MDAVILLDIDGVLNPQVHWDRTSSSPDPTLTLTKPRLALAQELNTLGRVVWASTWSRSQTSALAAAIGLPLDTPSVGFVETRAEPLAATTSTWKLPFVKRWLDRQERIQDRSYEAVVWIDDDLSGDADLWAHESSSPTLLIRTEPTTGLTSSGVDRVRTFLADAG